MFSAAKYRKMLRPNPKVLKNSPRFVSQFSLKAENDLQAPKDNQHWSSNVFSGIQPTGVVHLGNYLGAVRHWVRIQNEMPSSFCVVDLHAITLPQDPIQLRINIKNTVATLLACGINPEKSRLFLQSSVPQHNQLCWQLACLSTMARLAHLPQYKEKSALLKDVPLGLFIYPVLQAADILVHKATHVPVGEDQVQHLQLAQTLSKMFNHRYGPTFPTPKPLIAENCKVKSLRDPTKKMSKSDKDPRSRIALTDSPEIIVAKIKKAVTDFTSEVSYDPETRPGVSNLISIHSSLTGQTPQEICDDMQAAQVDTGKYKFIVAEAVVTFLGPIREQIQEILNKPRYIEDVLENSRIQATAVAQQTLDEVHEKVGTVLDKSDIKCETFEHSAV